MAICKAEEWHRDGRGLWAMRSCISHDGHKSAHTFEPWRYNVALPAIQGGIGIPDNPEIIQRLTTIRRALTHPRFYDGDIGADIRWLLSSCELLRQELIGANEMKAAFEQSAAEGWASYRELKAFVKKIRDRFAGYRLQRPRYFNAESESRKDIVAAGYDPGDWRAEVVEREDKLMDLFVRDLDAIPDGRCEGRYPVPQTAPPRDEPFDVTYRCALPKGHEGPHRSEP